MEILVSIDREQGFLFGDFTTVHIKPTLSLFIEIYPTMHTLYIIMDCLKIITHLFLPTHIIHVMD